MPQLKPIFIIFVYRNDYENRSLKFVTLCEEKKIIYSIEIHCVRQFMSSTLDLTATNENVRTPRTQF